MRVPAARINTAVRVPGRLLSPGWSIGVLTSSSNFRNRSEAGKNLRRNNRRFFTRVRSLPHGERESNNQDEQKNNDRRHQADSVRSRIARNHEND